MTLQDRDSVYKRFSLSRLEAQTTPGRQLYFQAWEGVQLETHKGQSPESVIFMGPDVLNKSFSQDLIKHLLPSPVKLLTSALPNELGRAPAPDGSNHERQ